MTKPEIDLTLPEVTQELRDFFGDPNGTITVSCSHSMYWLKWHWGVPKSGVPRVRGYGLSLKDAVSDLKVVAWDLRRQELITWPPEAPKEIGVKIETLP